MVRRIKALLYRGLKVPPGNWFAPPGRNRSGSGGNEAAGEPGDGMSTKETKRSTGSLRGDRGLAINWHLVRVRPGRMG